jgi:hypothetical protein
MFWFPVGILLGFILCGVIILITDRSNRPAIRCRCFMCEAPELLPPAIHRARG